VVVVFGQGLVVADPAAGQHGEAGEVIGAFDDLNSGGREPSSPRSAGVRRSRHRPTPTNRAQALAQRGQQPTGPIAVLDSGHGDHEGQDQPTGVDRLIRSFIASGSERGLRLGFWFWVDPVCHDTLLLEAREA
jgi:hypothetical protein